MKYLILFICCFTSLASCAQIPISRENIGLDDSLQIAVIQIPREVTVPNNTSFTIRDIPYTLELKDKNAVYSTVHKLTVANKEYKAYITSLPLFQIDAPNGIVNEPKRLSRISYADKDTTFTSYAGIELRGSSSLVFPKKTYDINFYTDSTGFNNQDFKLAGMRSDDDWILDGLHNEPLRIRSYLSLNLWNDIYTPHYIDREPKAKGGVTATHSEVFVNGRYKGVFLLQEQIDRKLTKIKKPKNGMTCGEIFQGARYLGASSFDSIPKLKKYLSSWGGYDIKYPDPTEPDWDNVYDFTIFVVKGDNDAFAKAISQKFVIANAVDYFLYINALRAPDNLGKNLFLIRYDVNEPYFYAPWDLDGTFGTIYSGKRINTTNDFLNNGLLRRLLDTNADDFVAKFKSRWLTLRQDILNEEQLLKKQKVIYNNLLQERVYEREALVWNDFIYDAEGLEYMQQWTRERLDFLDQYINDLEIEE